MDSTRNPNKYNLESGKYIAYGASPRASIALFIGSKARALVTNEIQVTPDHVKDVARNILRHRIVFFKALWFVAFLISSCFCGYLIFLSVQSFLDFEVVSKISVNNELPAVFPKVIINF